MARTLTDDYIRAIAREVAALTRETLQVAVSMREAMKLTSFGSSSAFHRWAKHNGLKSMRGAKGHYSIHAIHATVARSSNISGRRRA